MRAVVRFLVGYALGFWWVILNFRWAQRYLSPAPGRSAAEAHLAAELSQPFWRGPGGGPR